MSSFFKRRQSSNEETVIPLPSPLPIIIPYEGREIIISPQQLKAVEVIARPSEEHCFSISEIRLSLDDLDLEHIELIDNYFYIRSLSNSCAFYKLPST